LYKPYCRQQNGNRQQESHPGGNPSGTLRLFRQDNRVIPVFSIKPAASVTPSGFAQAGRQGDVGLHVAARTDGGEDDVHRSPSPNSPAAGLGKTIFAQEVLFGKRGEGESVDWLMEHSSK